jgi:hypothetical protein
MTKRNNDGQANSENRVPEQIREMRTEKPYGYAEWSCGVCDHASLLPAAACGGARRFKTTAAPPDYVRLFEKEENFGHVAFIFD